MAVTLVACTPSEDKEAFLETSIREQQQQKQNILIGYTILREKNVEAEATMVVYSATVTRDGRKIELRDSLLYSLTGDGMLVAQY